MKALEKITQYEAALIKWLADPMSRSERVPEPEMAHYGIRHLQEVFVARGVRERTFKKHGRQA